MIKETYKELVSIGNRIEDLSTRYDKLIDTIDEEEADDYVVLCDHEIMEHIEALYDNGLGADKVHDLVRLIFLKDVEMAKQIHKELSYWINESSNHESNNKS